MLTPILAEISSTAVMITMTAILGGVVLTGIIIVAGLKHSQRTQELWHQTARLALEKGQPLPPTPEEIRQRNAHDVIQDDFRNGLIMVATGIGIYIFLTAFISRALGYVGVIPLLVGLAMLLHAGVTTWLGRKNKAGAARNLPS